jgi:hypothetical protein
MSREEKESSYKSPNQNQLVLRKSNANKTIAQRRATRNRGAARGNLFDSYQTAQPRILGFPRFNNLNPFPPMLHRTMPYTSLFALTSSTPGVFGSQKSFVINSLNAPEPVGGHQPYGFDQLCAAVGPYTSYKVVRVRAKVTTNNEAGGVCYRLGTVVHNTTSTYAIQSDTIATAAEKPNVRLDFVSNTGIQSKTFEVDIPIYPLFNWTKNQFDMDMEHSVGTYNTSPAGPNRVHLDFAVASIGTPVTTCTVEFMFDVIFFDRFILDPS